MRPSLAALGLSLGLLIPATDVGVARGASSPTPATPAPSVRASTTPSVPSTTAPSSVPSTSPAEPDASAAAGQRAARPGEPSAATTARARRWMRLMQRGTPDRSELSAAMNAAVPDSIAALVAAQYGPLGDPTGFTFVRRQRVRGGTAYVYLATFESQKVTWIFALGDDGKVIGFHFYPPTEGS